MVQERTSLLEYIQTHFHISSQELFLNDELEANSYQFATFLRDTLVIESTEHVPLQYSDALIESVSFLEFVDLLSNAVRPSGALSNGLGSADLDALGKQVLFSFQSDKLKGAMWAKLCNRIGRRAFAMVILGVSGIFDAGAPQVSLKWQPFGKRQSVENPFLLSRSRMFYHSKDIKRNFKLLHCSVDVILTAVVGRPIVPGKVPKKLRILYRLLETAKRREMLLDYSKMRMQIESMRPLSSTVFDNCTPVKQVIRYVLIVLNHLFPPKCTFGTHNAALISRAVVDFIKLHRYERFDVATLVGSMKITGVPWLGKTEAITSVQDHSLRTELFKKFLAYVFGTMICTLVRALWYVTENQAVYGDANSFFPSRVWKALTKNWLNTYRDRFLERIESVQSVSDLKPEQLENLGILRLIPKKTDLRPLCVPCTRVPLGGDGKDERTKKIRFSQERVRPIRDILRFQQARFLKQYPKSPVGFFSVANVGKKILEFMNHAFKKSDSVSPEVYGVQFDMRHCYDNLNQLKIIACIDELFSFDSPQEEYFVRNVTSHSSNCGKYRTSINVISTRADIHMLDVSRNERLMSRKDVMTDGSRLTKYNKSDVLDLVRSQVIDPVVQVLELDGQFYKRTRGVFQGFPLLATLCDIVYNSLVEKVILLGVAHRESLFVRLADDFLFLSLHKKDCVKVFDNANSERAQDYGAYINKDKVKFIDCHEPDLSSTSFVGLEIDVRALCVKRGPAPPIKIPQRSQISMKSSLEYLVQSMAQRLLEFLIDLDFVPIDGAIDNLESIFEPITACAVKIFKKFECDSKQEMLDFCMHRIYLYTLQKWESLNGRTECKRLYEFIESVQCHIMAATN